jgi:SAM-dependent methyltransferase
MARKPGTNGDRLRIQILRDASPEDVEIVFQKPDGPVTITWDLVNRRMAEQSPQWKAWNAFLDIIKGGSVHQLLDIGGRARSGTLRASDFPDLNVDVLDILPDEGVNYVGDAHRASHVITGKTYDAIMSTSVFEHLIMPWKAAIEINRLLKPGGYVFIHTHQSIGMHDLPWDYFRFSDTSWKGIFNRATGFEIVSAAMQDMMYVLPCLWEPRHANVEVARGFENSAVLARKVGESLVDWDLGASDVTDDLYPE